MSNGLNVCFLDTIHPRSKSKFIKWSNPLKLCIHYFAAIEEVFSPSTNKIKDFARTQPSSNLDFIGVDLFNFIVSWFFFTWPFFFAGANWWMDQVSGMSNPYRDLFHHCCFILPVISQVCFFCTCVVIESTIDGLTLFTTRFTKMVISWEWLVSHGFHQ